MASNHLAIGARALLAAGADPHAPTSQGETPMTVAQQSGARDVIKLIKEFSSKP